MNNFRFVKLQSVIFTPDLNLGNRLALINWFTEIAPDIFNGEVTSTPLSQDTSPEIPRIVLQSKEQNWALNISLSRTDIVFLSIPSNSSTIPLDEYIEVTKKVFSEYKNKYDVFINRMALITERVPLSLDTTPAKYLSEKFCKREFTQGPDQPEGEGAFFNTNSFEIHNLKKYLWKDFFHINSWVRVRATSLKGQEDQPVLLVHNDINTQFETSPSEGYSAEEIATFFSESPTEIDNILKLYFSQG